MKIGDAYDEVVPDPKRADEFVRETAGIPGELQLLEVPVPLREAAERRVGQDVVVWIPGGMKVDGELRSVNDDDTLTIREARREFDVALQSVAVIEGTR